jgi:ABC-type amino acid transport substrate-binding protein
MTPRSRARRYRQEAFDSWFDDLIQHRVDAVLHDEPVLQWLLSQNEGQVVMISTPITQQPIGWMLRREDRALREAVNAALVTMRVDGTLDAIVARWIPVSTRGH